MNYMMKTAVGVFSMLAVSAGIEVSAQSTPQPVVYQNGMAKGVVRVKFAEDVSPQLQSFGANSNGISTLGISTFDVTAKRFSASNMRRVFPYNPKTEHKLIKHGLHLWYEMEVDSESDLRAVTNAFASIQEVEFAEPMLEKKLVDGDYSARTITFEEAKAMTTQQSTSDFNDPMLDKQWHYNNTQQRAGWVEGADIRLFDAWEKTTGSSNVVVAVHDEGIDVEHEDLVSNMWINEGEIPGNGIDDDGNGYVDDVYGYSFSNRTGDIPAQVHGTHVGGTVAATSNNGIGVAGVAGGDGSGNGARLMTLQILGGQYGDVAPSYVYAADNGAVISQNSWGYTSPGTYEQVVLDAIDYFIEEAGDFEGSPMKGGIVIFAAGNDDYDGPMWPGYYEKTLTVAATGPTWEKAWYSNYGDWIHISAPGGDRTFGGEEAIVLSTLPSNGYGYLDGTSMACPHVSGVAALVVSHLGGPSYTADILWNQLINSTNDIEQYNESYVGKLGYGQIDAAKALIKNEGIGPEAIVDLMSDAASDNFISLKWSTPNDEDDGYPASYVIYYSEEEITADNYISAMTSTQRAENVPSNTSEIDGLEANKMYYFMIKSFDRWGNESGLSNIISASTNNGPTVVIPSTSVDFMLEGTNLMETQTVMMNNEGEGLLRWESSVNQGTYFYDWQSYTTFPQVGNPSQRVANVRTVTAPSIQKFSMEEDELAEYENSQYTYSNWFHPIYNIGEEDLSLSNTSAVAYLIGQKEGFNLTDAEIFINELTVGPVEVEVYQGPNLSTAKLVTSATIDWGLDYQKTHYVQFDQQVFFPQNSVVWLLVKTKAGNKYPLSMSMAANGLEDVADMYQWMSFDDGDTWVPLHTAIEATGYAFTQSLVSKNASFGEVVKISPMSGEIAPGESVEVTVDADAMGLINGDYKFYSNIESNDRENERYTLPVNVKVRGRLPEIKSMAIVEFGSVILGFEKEVSVDLSNYGYGNFGVSSIDISDPQFTVSSQPYTINARSRSELILNFKPTMAGNANAEVKITSSTGIEHTFSLFAVVGEPAEIEVAPLEQTIAMAKGDGGNGEVTITNNGAYPLTYVMPTYSDNIPEGTHKFGYSWTKFEDIDASNFVSIKEADGAFNIAQKFVDDPSKNWEMIKMNFDFPFYGEYQSEMYVSHAGVVALDNTSNFNSSANMGNEYLPYGFISALHFSNIDLGIRGGIWIKHYDDKTVVEYNDVQMSWWPGGATFQIVMFATGDIEILYNDMSQVDSWDINGIFVGIEEPAKEDGVLVYENRWSDPLPSLFENQNQNVRVRFYYPGSKIITNLSSAEGVIGVGQSETITFDIDDSQLIEGQNVQNIAVASNDPNLPISHFKVIVYVMGGTAADIELSTTDVDYQGKLLGGNYLHLLALSNVGDKSTDIVSASLTDGTHFSVDFEQMTLNPRSGRQMNVYFNPTIAGEFTDVLTLMDSDGKEYVINLKGTGLNPPAIDLDVTPHVYNLKHGESTEFEITVHNTDGLVDLDILPRHASWLSIVEDEAQVTNVPEFDYTWRTNQKQLQGFDDPEAPSFEWYDIISEENRITHFETEDEHWWEQYDLPWPVKFYGKEYNEIYVAFAGVVALSKPHNLYDGIFNTDLPLDDGINNIASSIWMLGATNPTDASEIKGIFMHADEEKVVITHSRYQHNFAFFGGFVTCQTVFFRDGTVKMQYKVENQNGVDGWSNMTTIGLENEDGTSAAKVAYGAAIIKDRLVVEYVPAHKMTIAAGTSKTLKFKVDASELMDGTYNTNLTFQNITPGKEEISIPVQVNVEGEVIFGADDVDFGEVVAGAGVTNTEYFQFKNTGSKDVTINSFKLNDDTQSVVELKEVVDGFWGPETYWTDINMLWNFPMTVHPGDALEFRAMLTATTSGNINDVLTAVDVDGMEHNVNIIANGYEPSKFSWDGTDKEFTSLDPQYKDEFMVTVSNEGGKSMLDYTLEIDFNRDGSEMEAPEGGDIMSFGATSSTMHNFSTMSVANEDDFHSILKYTDEVVPTTAVGYGGDAMTIATAFVAPSEGFNLSHVETFYRPFGKDNGNIKVNILAGGSINSATEVYENVFPTETLGTDSEGDYQVFDLGEEITFFPGEKFFVVFTYDQGVEYPQGIVVEDPNISSTFYIYTDEGFVDITTDASWSGLRWVNKAMAKNPIKGTWIEIDSEGGQLDLNATASFKVSLDASYAFKADNFASVKAYTNDPSQPEVEFLVTLRKNASPSFIDPVSTIDMDVLTEQTIEFEATDREDHAIVYGIETSSDAITAEEVEGKYRVTIAPKYSDGEMIKFYVTATDELDGISTHEVIVNVNLINRAPMYIGEEVMEMKVGENFTYATDEFFMDEDGDLMTFEIAAQNHGIAVATMAGEDFFMAGISIGTTEVAVMATDANGESTIQTIEVNIVGIEEEEDITSIDQDVLVSEVKNFPNPVITETTISFLLKEQGDVSIAIYNMNGGLVERLNAGTLSSGVQNVEYNATKLNTGMYIYAIMVDNQFVGYNKLIKQ